MQPRRPATFSLRVLLVLASLTGACSASEATRAAQEGAALYERGDHDAALPLLEKAAEKGLEDGDLFYRLGYIYNQKASTEQAKGYWERAIPLLEKRADSPDSRLETHYYLTAIFANLQRGDEMKRTARRGVEKFGQRHDLPGSELFRLGRLYQFLDQKEQAAAAYRRGVEAFASETSPNPMLYALALTADARADFQARRFGGAALKFERATRVNPKAAILPFERALAHLGAGDYDAAAVAFAETREDPLATEAQYGADLARHLKAAGGPVVAMPEGESLAAMDEGVLEKAILARADSLRRIREQAEKGNARPESVREAERVFFSLASEWMIRGRPIREPALAGGYAELIRR